MKKKFKMIFYKLIIIILFVYLFIFFNALIKLSMLPSSYLIVIFILLLLFILFLCNISNKMKWSKTFLFLSLLSIVLLHFAHQSINKTIETIDNVTTIETITTSVSIITLSDENYNSIEDLEGLVIGFNGSISDSYYSQIDNLLVSKIGLYEQKSYSNSAELVDDILLGNVGCMIIKDAVFDMITTENPELLEKLNVLFTHSFDEVLDIPTTDFDVTTEPFTVLISGSDQTGDISRVTRSDVNVLLTINPLSKQILIHHIPRDSYVKFSSYSGSDKLTHASVVGVDELIHTIEDFIDIEIDFYAKFNFTSFENIIDAIGGLTVNSDISFSIGNLAVSVGENNLNGEQALLFARERYSFEDDDVQRGKNQIILIESILNKVVSPVILTKYHNILNAISDSFITSMSSSQISSLVKFQLHTMASWEIIVGQSCIGEYVRGDDYPSLFMPDYELKMYEVTEESVDTIHQEITDLKNDYKEEVSLPFVGPLQLE